MRPIRSKARIFILGLAGWSIPCAAFAVSDSAEQPVHANARLALASIRPIGDDELEHARGGFSIDGINFNFGASIQTMVNGQLALQTNLQWTPMGAVVTQLQGLGTQIQTQVASTLASEGINVPTTKTSAPETVGSSPVTQTASTTPVTVGAVPASNTAQTGSVPMVVASAQTPSSGATSLTGGSITSSPISTNPISTGVVNSPTTAGNAPSSTATVPVSFVNVSPTTSSGVSPGNAANVPVQGNNAPAAGNSPGSSSGNSPTVLSGVQIQSPTGSTEILANVANGQIQNIILNSASNQNIVQNTNITLTIYNFTSWQQMLAQHALSAQLTNQLQAASGFTMGH
jgi:hypothetical protein